MRMLENGVRLKDIEPHNMMIVLVFELFTRQAQPKVIKECTPGKVVFDLRNNISGTQMQRLIQLPLARDMPEYEWILSTEDKTLTANLNKPVKKAKANAKKDTKTDIADTGTAEES